MQDAPRPQEPSGCWKKAQATGRWFCHGEDGKHLVAGDDGQTPQPRYWFAVYRGGEEIAQGDGYGSIQEAQVAAEAV